MKKTPKLKIIVFKDKRCEFRWHMKRCGRIVAESGEGYKRVSSCLKSLNHIIESLAKGSYTFDDGCCDVA